MAYVQSIVILAPGSDSPIRFTRGILVDDSIVFAMPAAATATASVAPVAKPAKPQHVPDKKYKCQFCARAFSRSEHRSRHERSRKFLRAFPVSRWRGCSPHGGVVKPTFCLLLLTSFLLRRHQRATFQMRKVPQYLCTTRSSATA